MGIQGPNTSGASDERGRSHPDYSITLQDTALLPPTASTSVQSTITSSVKSISTSAVVTQPQWVITTCPALGAVLTARTVLQFQLLLPRKSTTLPNYVCF
uniref:Uncharacterized protein n=1 Tax=Romanomermis culicivorax TaxID=13658 RepID=A0A915KS34_ROMCU